MREDDKNNITLIEAILYILSIPSVMFGILLDQPINGCIISISCIIFANIIMWLRKIYNKIK